MNKPERTKALRAELVIKATDGAVVSLAGLPKLFSGARKERVQGILKEIYELTAQLNDIALSPHSDAVANTVEAAKRAWGMVSSEPMPKGFWGRVGK